MNLFFFSTAWGPRFGGINAFNFDLCCSLARTLGSRGTVYCAVPGLDAADCVQALAEWNVVLIPLPTNDGEDFSPQSTAQWIPALQEFAATDLKWWIGHDVTSGWAALAAAASLGGRSAIINHMSYIDYHAVKSRSPSATDRHHQEQRTLFRQPDKLFAVGPLLRDTSSWLAERQATMLVPGFPGGAPARQPSSRFTAITLGRFDEETDQLKQGRLAAAAFGNAIGTAERYGPGTKLASANPLIYVLGVTTESMARTLEAEAERHAGHAVNILPLPFDQDRAAVIERVRESDVALMLSWQEGFGLAGWEAIGSEVPLIVSAESGVFRLVEEVLGGSGKGCLFPIRIGGSGSLTPNKEPLLQDVEAVAQALTAIANRVGAARSDAKRLRALLVNELGCTWEHTAKQFITVLLAPTQSSTPATVETKSRVEVSDPHNHPPNIRVNAVERYFSKDDFFDACLTEVQQTQTLRMTLVGPTFLEPDWWHKRCSAAEGGPDFAVAVRDRLLRRTQPFRRCEIILRNNRPRYVENLQEFIYSEDEWHSLVEEMYSSTFAIFGERGEAGPRIRCIDPGYHHLPHIFDDVVLIGTRPSPKERVSGGWRITDPQMIEMERERWKLLFDKGSQDQRDAVVRLRRFLQSMRRAYKP